MPLHISSIHSFLLVSRSPSYGCTTVCLTFPQFQDVQVVSSFGHYEWSHCKYSPKSSCVNIHFHISWGESVDYWVIWWVYVQLYKKLPNCFVNYLYNFSFSSVMYEFQLLCIIARSTRYCQLFVLFDQSYKCVVVFYISFYCCMTN